MEAVKAKNSIHDFRSELNQIVWSRACSKREFNIEYHNIEKYKWILGDFYKDSRTKVIGKAIGDCVAGEGAFEDKTPEDIITFKDTNPETYGPENWNAVILYNYVHEVINGTAFKEYLSIDEEKNRYYYGATGWDAYNKKISSVQDVLQDKLKEIKKYYESRYDTELGKAAQDIQKYVDALKLNKWLPDFRCTELNYCASDFHSCSDLAPYLDGDFSEIGGALSASFFRVDKDNALTKRLSYDLELEYHDHNLYVFGLEIGKESWEEDDGTIYWVETDRTSLLALSELEESSEFRWIMERLEGLVAPPTEKLWNEWHPKKK